MGKKMETQYLILLFIAGAALSWGLYVPMVHNATLALKSSLRAFLFVGIAYFVTAVLIPVLFVFLLKWDPTIKPGGAVNFDFWNCLLGFAGGTLGATGALCIIFAGAVGGKAAMVYVPPLVFAGAPIINTLAVLIYFHPAKEFPKWQFFLGLIMAACGAALVMFYKPEGDAAHAPAPKLEANVAPASGSH
ncbi:MAG: hypothetical protein JWM11_6579 [Planctomycetaceae bacterium]|nr:hypothetical protein [Planctomycetaceae bacterium]